MAAPVEPDWYEHAPTIAAIACSAILSLVGLVVWLAKKLGDQEIQFLRTDREEAKAAVTKGFFDIRADLQAVTARLEKRIEQTATALQALADHTGEAMEDLRDRQTEVEIACAGNHGPRTRSGLDRRKS